MFYLFLNLLLYLLSIFKYTISGVPSVINIIFNEFLFQSIRLIDNFLMLSSLWRSSYLKIIIRSRAIAEYSLIFLFSYIRLQAVTACLMITSFQSSKYITNNK